MQHPVRFYAVGAACRKNTHARTQRVCDVCAVCRISMCKHNWRTFPDPLGKCTTQHSAGFLVGGVSAGVPRSSRYVSSKAPTVSECRN